MTTVCQQLFKIAHKIKRKFPESFSLLSDVDKIQLILPLRQYLLIFFRVRRVDFSKQINNFPFFD